jgi:hypothetical protein
MVSSGMLRHVALVRTDISEEPSASIRVTRIGELGTTLAATNNLLVAARGSPVVWPLSSQYTVSAVLNQLAYELLCNMSVSVARIFVPGSQSIFYRKQFPKIAFPVMCMHIILVYILKEQPEQ